MTSIKVPVIELEDGELALEFPDDFAEKLNFTVGDIIVWSDNSDGSWTISKE